MTLPVTDTALIGTCLAAAALGLIVLTSSGGNGNATDTPEPDTETSSLPAITPAPGVDPEFGAQVRDYLLANPEVIFEAVSVFEERTAAAQAGMDGALIEANAAALFEDSHSFVSGNPEGDIRLVEFIDYRCGFCQRAHEEMAEVLETDGGIRLITKEFPILGPDSESASRFAISVLQIGGDAAYARAHSALMRHREAITPDFLETLAADLELDFDEIAARMDSDAVTEILAENRALAQRLQVSGTPTYVMETELIRGFIPAEVMLEIAADLRG